MTNRDSDASCLPARPPQHAAPVRFLRRPGSAGQLGVSGRAGRPTRPVRQLFITLVTWAAGLSLVIGSIVLVATVTAPRHATPPLRVLRDAGITAPVQYGALPPSGDAAARPSYHVLRAFSGHGSRRTAQFTVKAKRPWQLRWTYSCAGRASTGQFTVLRADMAPGREIRSTGIEEDATSGHGSAWFKPSSHQHYLVVISACSWHIKVVQAA